LKLNIVSTSLAAAMLAIMLSMTSGAGWAANSISGEYACRSIGNRPCDAATGLVISDNGYWGWGKYSGQYKVSNERMEFVSGNGGPITWGPAVIGTDTLTFTSGGNAVVYQKSSPAGGKITGSYYCSTAPGGCQTRQPIILEGDGQWSWGAMGGSYSIVGGKAQFKGSTSGPPGWGPADISDEALTFRSRDGSSDWRTAGAGKRTNSNTPVFEGHAEDFDLSGFPSQPTNFEEQRILAQIKAVGGSYNVPTQVNAHQMLARYYTNKGDGQRARSEQAKAEYWRHIVR
jgi:hypothetical protein